MISPHTHGEFFRKICGRRRRPTGRLGSGSNIGHYFPFVSKVAYTNNLISF